VVTALFLPNKQLGLVVMDDQNTTNKGQEDAGTLPSAQELAASMVALAAKDGDDQSGLFEGGGDLLGELAENSNAIRRARGRPLNSANRRNSDLFDLAMARGFKHPFVRLMEIVSADPAKLCGDRIEAMKLQIRAAEVLLPYDMAKRPTEVKVAGEVLHMFVAGNLTGGMKASEKGFTLHGNAEEYQELNQTENEAVSQAAVSQINQVIDKPSE
jgi:hypothetical protein